MENTKLNVLEWAKERQLLKKENVLKQYSKLQEESNELLIAILNEDVEEQIDAIGDCMIVLTILANQLGLDINECYKSAYNVIKNRTGKTVNGNFIKDK
jgi:NTP pyrophosphatase (non-canonical NTP hydrolase)